jgi:RNA polymerase sigma-70 factor (ECF subfamily)
MNTDVNGRVPAELPAYSRERFAMNFDAAFLTRLQQRDPDTCTFLISSLTPVLEARLRYKVRDHAAIEDIRNETFYRVFCMVDGGRIRKPEQLGSFVRGVCDRVAQESRRKTRAAEPLPDDGTEPADGQPPLDNLLLEKEASNLLWREVMKLSEKDRVLILELLWQERDRRDLARERGIGATGLNVRLCRALKRLRLQLLAQEPAMPTPGARILACRVPPRRHVRGATRSPNRWSAMAA